MRLAVLLACAAWAADPADPVNKNRKGIALRGYDPVAYFTEHRPVKGGDAFSYHWMGGTWLFSSAAHRDSFQGDPAKYAPQFGGYCAYAASENYIYDGDPEVWRVVDGKLYVNYNRKAQGLWEAKLTERIAAGHRNWPLLHR